MKNLKQILIVFTTLMLLFTFSCSDLVNKNNSTPPPQELSIIYDETGEYTNYGLPIIIIETENHTPIVEKKVYIDGQIKVINAPNDFNFDFTKTQIRGRGNSSWSLEKKTYRIKLDKKQSMFGSDYQAKSWTLIANHSDKTFIRNKLAYDLSREMDGLIYSPMTEMIELYLNGEYQGLYMFCDHNQVNEGRVDIKEPKKSYTGDCTDIGFFMELNYIGRVDKTLEDQEWFFVFGSETKVFELKTPDPDDFTDMSPFINYIKPIIENVDEVILSKNFENIQEVIDIDSFIDYFLIQELFKNADSGFASVHCYKMEKDSKIYMGPVWDFDISTGNYKDVNESADGFYAQNANRWFKYLMETPEFKAAYVARWNEVYTTILPSFFENIKVLGKKYEAAANHNFEKWPILDTYVWPNPDEVVAIDTYNGQINYLNDYLKTRAEWLNAHY